MDLRFYADDHGGWYPRGQRTPEACLGLLYNGSNDYLAEILRGKIIPVEVTREALTNRTLGPESCGWHYVEGLTKADDPQIAIVWDKVGLGHNGQRLKRGGHEVVLLDGSTTIITGEKWPAFLAEQTQLLANRDPQAAKGIPALVATIRLPTGEVTNHYAGPYKLVETTSSKNGSGHGSSSGNGLDLQWYRFGPDEQITFVLTLPNLRLRSKSVTFHVKNGRASPSSIIFEMETY